MRTVEITRAGNAPVFDQVVEMRAWLRDAGIQVIKLEAIRVLRARVCYRASFATAEDAQRFCARFGRDDAADPP